MMRPQTLLNRTRGNHSKIRPHRTLRDIRDSGTGGLNSRTQANFQRSRRTPIIAGLSRCGLVPKPLNESGTVGPPAGANQWSSVPQSRLSRSQSLRASLSRLPGWLPSPDTSRVGLRTPERSPWSFTGPSARAAGIPGSRGPGRPCAGQSPCRPHS